MKNNGLSTSTIKPGQVLNVPAKTYKVVSGDSLYIIAKKCSISFDNIKIANNNWSDTIFPGDVLNIPITSTNGQVTPTPPNTSGVIKYSASDVDLLARLITAESGGESHDAMLSVGAVVVNRVQSSQWPNTISGVINQVCDGYYQFSPVLNGMIKKPASQAAITVASEALKGSDPTKGALYFYDNTVTNKWLTSKPVAASLGKLTFAY